LKLEEIYRAIAKRRQGEHSTTAPGRPKNTSAEFGNSVDTREEIAKVAKVSHGITSKVKVIEEKATPEKKARLIQNIKLTGYTSI